VQRGCAGLAALIFCLLATAPGEARKQAKDDGEQKERSTRKDRRAEAPVQDMVVLSGVGRDARVTENVRIPRRDHMPKGSLLGFDGLPAMDNGMIGRLPLHDRIDVGLGLFTVTGAKAREREMKRTDAIRDLAPPRSRVAGAGLRVNF
jgi:hypothetical protein